MKILFIIIVLLYARAKFQSSTSIKNLRKENQFAFVSLPSPTESQSKHGKSKILQQKIFFVKLLLFSWGRVAPWISDIILLKPTFHLLQPEKRPKSLPEDIFKWIRKFSIRSFLGKFCLHLILESINLIYKSQYKP